MTEIHLTKLIKHNDTWYKILRLLTDRNVMNKDNTFNMKVLGAWKDYVGADKVLHDPRGFMLCERIEEVDWVDVSDPDDEEGMDIWDHEDEDTDYNGEDEEYNDDEYEY